VRDPVNVGRRPIGVVSNHSRIEELVAMKAPALQPVQLNELDIGDLTQEIDAPLEDIMRRDEPTLSKLDFDELEFKLEF
jgi:hypothetical protein